MKNSKILSLLTAGALVVSSFSGLVMNGDVARAASTAAAVSAAYKIKDGAAATDGLAFVDTTNASAAPTLIITNANATDLEGIASTRAAAIAAATTVPTANSTIAGGTVASWSAGAAASQIQAEWTKGKTGVEYLANAATGTAANAAVAVVFGKPFVVNGVPMGSNETYYASAGETISISINTDLAALLDDITGAATRDAIKWTGTSDTDGVSFVTGGAITDVAGVVGVNKTIAVDANLAADTTETFTLDILADGTLTYPIKIKATAVGEISNKLTFVEEGFSNEQSVVAWPYNEDASKTFKFDDNAYLQELFFDGNVTNATIEIDYKLVNKAGSKLEIENGKSDGATPATWEKRETTFAPIKIKGGKTTSSATLTVNGKAFVSEYVTVNGVRTLNTHSYRFKKQIELVAGNQVGVQMTGAAKYTAVVDSGAEYAYVIGAEDPLTAQVVTAPLYNAAPTNAVAADIEYRLNKTTYLEIKGAPTAFKDRWTIRDVALPALNTAWSTVANAITFNLTDTAKQSVENVSTELYTTITYYDATGAEVAYASSTIRITLVAKTDFTIAMKTPEGEDYDSTIVWDVDDVAIATKDFREFYVRSNTVNYDLGAAGTDTDVYFKWKTGSHWKVQQIDNIGDWNEVTNGLSTARYRLWFDGATDVSDTLTITAVYGRTGTGIKRAVTTYTVKSQIGQVSLDVQEYWAVGDTLNLRDDVAVKYAGEAVSNEAPYVTWDLSGVENAEVGRLGDVLTIKKENDKFTIKATYRKAGTNTTAVASKELKTVKKLTLAGVDADLAMLTGESIDLTAALAATGATKVTSADATVARVIGNTVTGMKAGSTTLRLEDGTHNYAVVNLTVGGVTPGPDPSEHYAGEPVTEDGVTGYLNEDLQTVTVTDATVVSKAITIPATVQGFPVVAIDPQAFKKTDAKTVYVVGSVEELGKGAFKASKVKKVYFYDPAALKTVGKNAFKKTNAKVVGVAGSFDEGVAKDLKKAGAKSVKNNGTAK